MSHFRDEDEYAWYADLCGWEEDAPEINDIETDVVIEEKPF